MLYTAQLVITYCWKHALSLHTQFVCNFKSHHRSDLMHVLKSSASHVDAQHDAAAITGQLECMVSHRAFISVTWKLMLLLKLKHDMWASTHTFKTNSQQQILGSLNMRDFRIIHRCNAIEQNWMLLQTKSKHLFCKLTNSNEWSWSNLLYITTYV